MVERGWGLTDQGLSPQGSLKGPDVYSIIRRAITRGRYPPGWRLSEREMAMECKSSRTPVREALRLLMQDGLVVYKPRRGYRVIQISVDRARHVMVVREALEGLAARLASQLDPERTARALEKMILRARQAHKQGQLSELITANQRFHSILVEGSGNPVLISVYHGLQAYVGLMMSVSLSWPRRPEKTLKEHTKIVQALLSRNPQRVEEAAKVHIRSALQGLLQNVRSYLEVIPKEMLTDRKGSLSNSKLVH